jgi:ATP phosphoribosyltransferase
MATAASPVTIAVPKGRVTRVLAPLFERAGIEPEPLVADDRRLIRESADGRFRFLLLKPDDVPTYVEYGTADLGVGRCRMVVAGRPNATVPAVPRVATKYPRTASEHFASLGIQAEIIYVQGSVELAPLVGLADLIVDLVESGATLRDNGLVERETINEVSSVLIANPSLYKLRHAEIEPLIVKLRAAVG